MAVKKILFSLLFSENVRGTIKRYCTLIPQFAINTVLHVNFHCQYALKADISISTSILIINMKDFSIFVFIKITQELLERFQKYLHR